MFESRGRLFIGVAVVAAIALALGFAVGSGAEDGDTVATSAPKLNQPGTTGRDLADRFMTLIKDKDMAELQAFLSDAFIIQRADGSNAAKAEYLTRLPVINSYRIEDVIAMQDGTALTVRWSMVVDEIIDGKTYAGKPAPRLSTFVWEDHAWRMTSHANFNVPASEPSAAR